LAYLQFATSAEMFFALGRLMILIITTLSIHRVEQIPQALILFTILQMVMNTLSFIAMGNYWAEQIARESARAGLENEEIRSLLGERESLIASLLRANKTAATGALSASIAHELNQPLGASNLNIQFLQKKIAEGELSPKLAEEVLAALLADNQRAANIIKSLRAIFTESKLVAEKVTVRKLIDTVLQITNPETHSKNIEVLLKFDAEFDIEVNRNEIQQVILNLMNNAIEALSISSRADKKITIVSEGLANTWQLSISDNAEGISADDQVRLFELLGSGKKTGMGLGLWLCRHIVTRHGGEIWYEDVAIGGAKFVFTLPRNASALS
jgi:signal transduction histidine kinase